MPKKFKGKIELDVRDSVPDWDAFLPDKAPEGAPNVLVVLFDDTGCAAWSPYGGRIEMPILQRLADNGLTYSQWHTTALCSPTRSTFLTGRNHHQNGFAQIAEGAQGYPGYSSHIPPENATMATVLRKAGWSTYWIGKNHNVPIDQWSMGATKENWPLGMGYDRFYGFIGGETNQWYPDLVEDNHYIDQPYQPEDGYHLSKDLADKALQFIQDSKQALPDKPWYLWFCPGANHAPHHAPQDYIDKYKGAFDDGYEAYREWVLPRMIERGILPEGTQLTPINPMTEGTFDPNDTVRPWETLSDDEKRLFSRMAEVYAGFSEYTDAQVGRIIDYLEESDQLDNTLIVYCADNGASGEGGPNGSVNEGKYFNAWPDTMEDNLPFYDRIGTPDTYNHYPAGWAVAFSTPYRMFKRYSYQGGVCDPLVIHWPAGIQAKGEVRHQNQKETQYYEMMGTRGIWHKGWKAVTEHGALSGIGNLDQDRWQLFHTDEDRSEAIDLADKNPDKVEKMKALWLAEAEKYNVLPVNDMTMHELGTSGVLYRVPVPPSGQYTYYPNTSEVPEQLAANTHGVSYKILADVEFTPDTQGVIVAQGARSGGHALFVKNGKLHYVFNFLGIPPEQQLVGPAPTSGQHIVGVDFTKDRIGEHGEAHGTCKLFVDDQVIAEQEIRTIAAFYALCGEGLCVGYDSGDAVSSEYSPKFEFTGGTITKVVFDVADDAYVDVERHLAAAMARD